MGAVQWGSSNPHRPCAALPWDLLMSPLKLFQQLLLLLLVLPAWWVGACWVSGCGPGDDKARAGAERRLVARSRGWEHGGVGREGGGWVAV